MRTVQIKISETDFQKYNLGSMEIKFTDLVEMVSTKAEVVLSKLRELSTFYRMDKKVEVFN